MHDLLDDYAQSNALRDKNPRLKIFLGLGAILLSVFSATPIAPLIIALTMSLITVKLARIPWRFYSTLLLLPLSFAILSAVVVAFMTGTGDQILAINLFGFNLDICRDGANLAMLLIGRTFGGMCSLFFIALTTPMIEIFSDLKSLRVPETVIDLSMMIYRYIFVFLDQATIIHNAQVMRLGDAGIKKSLTSFSMLSSVLFLRAWEQGERLIIAMDARCYSGKLNIMEQSRKAEPEEIFAILGYMTAMTAVVFLTKDVPLL